MSTEQWKSGGDCGKCRRKEYCGAKCRESRKREKLLEREAFLRAMTMLANAKPAEAGEDAEKGPEDGERPEEENDGG